MAVHEFLVSGESDTARDLAADVLAERGFTLDWSDDWTARASKGNVVVNVLAGAFAQSYRLGLRVRSIEGADGGPDQTIVRIETLGTGLAGGIWGAKKTRSFFHGLRDELAARFASDGRLVGQRHPDLTDDFS